MGMDASLEGVLGFRTSFSLNSQAISFYLRPTKFISHLLLKQIEEEAVSSEQQLSLS